MIIDEMLQQIEDDKNNEDFDVIPSEEKIEKLIELRKQQNFIKCPHCDYVITNANSDGVPIYLHNMTAECSNCLNFFTVV